MLLIVLILLGCGVLCLILGTNTGSVSGLFLAFGIIFMVVGFLTGLCTLCGITCIDPNSAVIITFMTRYVGTIKKNGIFWTNPFYSRSRMSL